MKNIEILSNKLQEETEDKNIIFFYEDSEGETKYTHGYSERISSNMYVITFLDDTYKKYFLKMIKEQKFDIDKIIEKYDCNSFEEFLENRKLLVFTKHFLGDSSGGSAVVKDNDLIYDLITHEFYSGVQAKKNNDTLHYISDEGLSFESFVQDSIFHKEEINHKKVVTLSFEERMILYDDFSYENIDEYFEIEENGTSIYVYDPQDVLTDILAFEYLQDQGYDIENIEFVEKESSDDVETRRLIFHRK